MLEVVRPLVVPPAPPDGLIRWQSTSQSGRILGSVLVACVNIVALNFGGSGAVGISPSDAASGEIPA